MLTDWTNTTWGQVVVGVSILGNEGGVINDGNTR